MALDLRFDGDPVLRAVAVPVTAFDDDLALLVAEMLATMYAAPGRGLAAPQVGVSQRVFVIDTTWKDGDPDPQAFVNPQIIARSKTTATAVEACLSIPDRAFAVTRPTWVCNRPSGLLVVSTANSSPSGVQIRPASPVWPPLSP